MRREFPTCPPTPERLDKDQIAAAVRAGLPFDAEEPRLFCFSFGVDSEWQLHHACPFAPISWTNIYDPALLVFFGDIISGELSSKFGAGIHDIDLRRLRGQSYRFSHTRYWQLSRSKSAGKQVVALRKALDLPGLRLTT